MGKMPEGRLPAPSQGDPKRPDMAIWINVAESTSEYSDLRCNFEIKTDGQLGPGKYLAWLKWREDWAKWTGVLRLDGREEWSKALEQSNAPVQPPTDEQDIPF